MAFYSSFGAAGEVTGSCHLLEIGHIKILIDCGMFQGREEHLNFEPFGFDAKEINYLILTHAHLDHIGRVPLLVKEGFDKQIIATPATFEIARLMLKNSASILQESDNPLYTMKDLEPALKLFNTPLEYEQRLSLEENITISFKNAGHILGSCSVRITFFENGQEQSVIFSGDVGSTQRIITSKVDFWDKGNYLFIESTYGNRTHNELQLSIDAFKEKILTTLRHEGVVVLPSFALERTQEILYLLKELSEEEKLKDVTVFLDAPLAIDVTKTFLNYGYLFNETIQKIMAKNKNPFSFKELVHTYTKEESIAINSHYGKKIIIAGSGMCEGGRVGHHLRRYINHKNNLILFVGYQVKGTLGEQILSGNKTIQIKKSILDVKAHVDCIDGFSAHADKEELLAFIDSLKETYCIYLIHGDQNTLSTFKESISKELHEKVHVVKMKERIFI